MLLDKRAIYKPLHYPWAFDAFKKQEQMHWLPTEIVLTDDVNDWKNNLNSGQKAFLEHLFRFFTQQDVTVGHAYASKYLPLFSGNPEVGMMLASFNAMEAIHVWSYSLLIDTIGLPESEYSAFLDYAAMRDKYEFLEAVNTETEFDIAKAIAIYSAFTEGMQLYASFAMLMHFERLGRMPGMTNIVRFSMKDEMVHADSLIQLFKVFCKEYLNAEEVSLLEAQVRHIAEKMVELEDKFIDLAFSVVTEEELNQGLQASQEPLTRSKLRLYIRHISDYRLSQLGFQPIYGATKTPLKWLDDLMMSPEHANFFEVRPTQYAKGAVDTTGEILW
jgi:ribonucleoside-diphosphate reductase beta chain